MLERLTLHIGHPKTGTTSIQHTFRASADALAAAGVHYDASLGNHHALAAYFKSDRRSRSTERSAKQLLRSLHGTKLPRALVSTETMVLLNEAEAAACIAALRECARQVDVLVYVRHPVGFANSAAAQGVRSGRSLAEVEARTRSFPLRTVLKRWQAASGGALTVRAFERGQLANGDVVDDILAVIGASAAAPHLTRERSNEALSVLGIALLDAAQKARGKRFAIEMTRMFEDIGGPRYVLPQAALDRSRERGKRELAYLQRAHGITLEEPTLVPTPPAALSEAELQSLGRLLGGFAADDHPPAPRSRWPWRRSERRSAAEADTLVEVPD